jgi:hypothetical protein
MSWQFGGGTGSRVRSLERRIEKAEKRIETALTVILIGNTPIPEKLPPGSTVLRISRG